MDIQRPDLKKKKRARQLRFLALAVGLIAIFATAAARLRPAAPGVDRSAIWVDTVKHGTLFRQVHGQGALHPTQDSLRQIPAETEATVVRIRVLPGTHVGKDTVLLDMTNPQLEQASLDAKLQLKAAEAEYQSLRVRLDSDLMDQKARAATVEADYNEAQRQVQNAKALYDLGVISGLAYKASEGKAQELVIRNQLEGQRLTINQKALDTRLAEQQAKMDQVRALAELKQRQLEALRVRAGIDGVLVELGLQVGQHVSPGTMLAKVVEPNHLMAEVKIPETQAREVQLGQPATIDTHNGIIHGQVSRVDPAVQNGTVSVDVRLDGDLPQGARPDLSVEGTVDLDRVADSLYIGRPAYAQENSTISLFRLDAERKEGKRVSVKTGRLSADSIQILGGLQEGDAVILSDMSRWNNTDLIQLTN
jgi:HlyD family secretion protein